jgi:salicylate hydroxylase
MALAIILAQGDAATVPAALWVYERLRRERWAQIQRGARQNGLRVDSAVTDLKVRDAELVAHAEFRKQLYSDDVAAAARAAACVTCWGRSAWLAR